MDTDCNDGLAKACQSCRSACCKKGRILLLDQEYQNLKTYAARHASGLHEFMVRTQKHNGFHLYDQRERCQFLDKNNLCPLHDLDIKPRECFWWPYHIFLQSSPSNRHHTLQIAISKDCCDAYKKHDKIAAEPHLATIRRDSAIIGTKTLKAFRITFPGECDRISVETLTIISAKETASSTLNDIHS
jgi:hypothetical protein